MPAAATGFVINSCTSCAAISPTNRAHSAAADTGQVTVTATNCQWTAQSDSSWLAVTAGATGSGNGTVSYSLSANTGGPRSGTLNIGSSVFVVSQAGAPGCTYLLSTPLYPATAATQLGSVNVVSNCSWSAVSNAGWVTITSGTSGNGNGTVNFAIQGNTSAARNAMITIAATALTITQPAGSAIQGLRFVPITPCRAVDTRAGQGTSGALGPPTMERFSTRELPLPSSSCGIPTGVKAYSLNVTVVPLGPLGYLSLWPTGQPQPLVSTLNSLGGDIVANAAVVPGDDGTVSVYVTDKTDVVIDVNGYFVPSDFVPPGGSASLTLYPIAPCRAADTRQGQSASRSVGSPNIERRRGARHADTTEFVRNPSGSQSLLGEYHRGALRAIGLPVGMAVGKSSAVRFDAQLAEGQNRGKCGYRARGGQRQDQYFRHEHGGCDRGRKRVFRGRNLAAAVRCQDGGDLVQRVRRFLVRENDADLVVG